MGKHSVNEENFERFKVAQEELESLLNDKSQGIPKNGLKEFDRLRKKLKGADKKLSWWRRVK